MCIRDRFLEGPRRFVPLDASLKGACLRAATGEMAKKFAALQKFASIQGWIIRGRQLLWLFHDHHRVASVASCIRDSSRMVMARPKTTFGQQGHKRTAINLYLLVQAAWISQTTAFSDAVEYFKDRLADDLGPCYARKRASKGKRGQVLTCLLYTSDAADE